MSKSLDILAKNINWYLERNYKRPAWLAEESGIKPPNLSKILGRMGNPTLETIEALATAMDLHPADLIREYRDKRFFELIMMGRKVQALQYETEKLEERLAHATSEARPDTRIHPHTIRKQIEENGSSISRLQKQMEQLESEIRADEEKKIKNAEMAPKIARPEAAEEKVESQKSKADLISSIVLGLPPLNERELAVLVLNIKNFMTLKEVGKKNSAG